MKSMLGGFAFLAAVVAVATAGRAIALDFDQGIQVEPLLSQLRQDAASDSQKLSGVPMAQVQTRNTVKETEEGRTKGALGAVRSALAIYYGDHAGKYPKNFNALIPKYIRGVLFTQLPGTNCASSADIQFLSGVSTEDEIKAKITGKGGYFYVDDESSKMYGYFGVNCKEPDSEGMSWYLY